MKKCLIIWTLWIAAAMAFAAGGSERPESSVPTPAEKSEISREAPDLGAKESEDWQRLRAERREARQQILSDLRSRSAAEKQSIRQDISVSRGEGFRKEGSYSRVTQPSTRESFGDRQNKLEMNPPPPPPRQGGNMDPESGWGHHHN